MARIHSFELFAVDLPFHRPFRHAAAERSVSTSLFLKCTTDCGTVGWGESLPRPYVTGETRDGAVAMLRDEILPRLVGRTFRSLKEVIDFLKMCDGKTPGWVTPDKPQTAAWCAVDLALLDTLGQEQGEPVLGFSGLDAESDSEGGDGWQESSRTPLYFSGVLSASKGAALILSCLKLRLYGFRHVKMKVEKDTPDSTVRIASRILGKGRLRVDANMSWTAREAADMMRRYSRHGVQFFEQPIAADDLEGLSRLVAGTGLDVIADESLTDRISLERLLKQDACTVINVRVSKCGGIVASRERCREALEGGLKVQIGCQVGESSLLSAAHLILSASVLDVLFAEGCFGRHLLREDPVVPVLQFRYAGRAPRLLPRPGVGVNVDEAVVRRHARTVSRITRPAG